MKPAVWWMSWSWILITISAALDGAFISHVSLKLTGYDSGYPGDVIVPLVLFANDPMQKNKSTT